MELQSEVGTEPHPVQIVIPSDNHTFSLNEDALRQILMKDEVQDRYVIVVAVIGAFRSGKSFLLSFLLRYLNAKYVVKQNTSEWLGPENVPLEGFSWRGGSERHTTGIYMWSEVFLSELITGEKIAIILLDTQGAFDSKSTLQECATIIALSTLTSSVLINNISNHIQEDHLQCLELFSEYARQASEGSSTAPFQKLQFVVRDWQYPYDHSYGEDGGNGLLEQWLSIDEDQHLENLLIRKRVKSMFQDISCYLLPYPGEKVATDPFFKGTIEDMKDDFKYHLKNLASVLLAPENLILKTINGDYIKARDLLYYFHLYLEVFKEGSLPEPKTIFMATAEANNLSAVSDAGNVYFQLMDKICGIDKPYVDPKKMEAEHLKYKKISVKVFREKQKMGGEEMEKLYEEKLNQVLKRLFTTFKQRNEDKKTLSYKFMKMKAAFIAGVTVASSVALAILPLLRT